MLIGAMNHPGKDPAEEIEWMAGMDMEFIDLTLEPPRAGAWQVDAHKLRDLIRRHNMGVVGHTAYYLPLASPFEELRRTAVEACRRCMEVLAEVGAKWMNIHPDTDAPLHPKQFLIDRNRQSLEQLLEHTQKLGVGLMVENIPGRVFNSREDLGALLDSIPELGLHLDLGHCNLSPINRNAETILSAYGSRLKHVHLHDNKGGSEDLHLALGCGTINTPGIVRALKTCGYDGTITLEVFSPDRHYLEYSRDLLRKIWKEELLK
jgi:sugar phosphate isomerase/epimerase